MEHLKLLFLFRIKRNCWRSGKSRSKKGDKTDCSNYRGISLLPTTYIILSSILLSRLKPYAEEIIEDPQCEFWCNRSNWSCILHFQILYKKWEYNEAVNQLFINFKKPYDLVRREVLYNILIESGIPVKLVRLIKMCLNETYSTVWVGKHLKWSQCLIYRV